MRVLEKCKAIVIIVRECGFPLASYNCNPGGVETLTNNSPTQVYWPVLIRKASLPEGAVVPVYLPYWQCGGAVMNTPYMYIHPPLNLLDCKLYCLRQLGHLAGNLRAGVTRPVLGYCLV